MQNRAISNMKQNPRTFYRLMKHQHHDNSARILLQQREDHGQKLYTLLLPMYNMHMPKELYLASYHDVFTVKNIYKAIRDLHNNKALDQ